MTRNDINLWMNLKFGGRSNLPEMREFKRLENKWEMEKVDLIMQGAKRLLVKLQS